MATIKFIKPKKEFQTDAFLIDFNLTKGGPLTVVIEDKYPEFIPPQPSPPEESELEISGDFTIKEKDTIIFQNNNVNAVIKLPKAKLTGGTSTSSADAQINEEKIPSFTFRQFYYRLTDDTAKATFNSSNNTITFNKNDIQPVVYFPDEYRIRYLNQNGQRSIIYRFDITASDFSKGGNYLLEILIND